MSTWTSYPKISEVIAEPDHQLLVVFHNGERKRYDFKPKLMEPAFRLLKDEMFFRTVKVDAGGYGIVWSDELDLAESELWLNGTPVEAALATA